MTTYKKSQAKSILKVSDFGFTSLIQKHPELKIGYGMYNASKIDELAIELEERRKIKPAKFIYQGDATT
jgi:hypothetical protein